MAQNVVPITKKCPHCGRQTLVTDNYKVWCSFSGDSNDESCLFGIYFEVKLNELK